MRVHVLVPHMYIRKPETDITYHPQSQPHSFFFFEPGSLFDLGAHWPGNVPLYQAFCVDAGLELKPL